jgi:hypothetical protein
MKFTPVHWEAICEALQRGDRVVFRYHYAEWDPTGKNGGWLHSPLPINDSSFGVSYRDWEEFKTVLLASICNNEYYVEKRA